MEDSVKIYTVAAVTAPIIFCFLAWLIRRYYNVVSFFIRKKPLDSARHGGEVVAEVLKAHKVKFLFTLTGGHISPIIVGAEKAGIRVVDTRHEATAVFAADAVARLTGNIGVVAVTAGPGVTNTITAVTNAKLGQSPVLILGGAAPSLLKGRGALQDIDQLSFFKPICKYSISVRTVRAIIPSIRKAIQIAKSDTPGPVFVELPIEILYPFDVVSNEYGTSKIGKSLWSRIINCYVDWSVYNIFYNGFELQDVKSLPVKVPRATNCQVYCAFTLLSRSKRPVLIVGSQALIPPGQAKDLRNAVNSLNIPCFLGGMARGLLGKDNPLQLRHTRKDVLADADFVILAGAVCDFRLSYGKVFSKSSKIIIVNRNKQDMLMNSDMFWEPKLVINGCSSDFLQRLSQLVLSKQLGFDEEWIKMISVRDIAKEHKNREHALNIPDHNINPLKVLYDVEETIMDGTIVVVDGGDFVATASYIVRPRAPLTWLDPGPFGTLGVGAGFALGAKLCNPTSNVLILFGDGSLGYSLIEFDTFVRHKLPVVAIVGNDACWSQIARDQVKIFGSNVGCALNYSKYESSVTALGAKGILVDEENQEKFKELIYDASLSSIGGSTTLFNVLISNTKFRDGSTSV